MHSNESAHSDDRAATVTRLLNQAGGGDDQAAAKLLPLVYHELRELAQWKMRQERPDQTLQATALVHEAYLRLVGPDSGDARHWDNRGHFFAAAAEAMRRILIDNARRRARPKHGGDRRRVDLEQAAQVPVGQADAVAGAEELLALDAALTKLAEREPTKAELVKLRFFAGLSVPQAARVLGISDATAERYWAYARTWLYCELNGPQGTGRAE